MKILMALWNDEAGFVISTELVLVATILVLGMIVGLTTLRNDVVQELADLAGAIGDISQDYAYSAVMGHGSSTAGSEYRDRVDFCGDNDDRVGNGDQCVNVNSPPGPEGEGEDGDNSNEGGRGNNGVGNGEDGQPPGNPPINDGPGTGPGNPGNRS